MKKLILLGLLIPSLAVGQQNPFVRNDNNTATLNGANLRQGSASVDTKGILSVKTVDGSGANVNQSVIPASGATSLNGMPAINVGYYFVIADTVEAGSTTTVINATAHSARVGDVLSFRTGTAANGNVWSPVTAVTTNTITLANALPTTPAVSDNFHILRPEPFSLNANNGASVLHSLNVAINTDGQPSNSTGLLKLEDAPAASGDALAGVAGVVNTAASTRAADGDYIAPAFSASGTASSQLVYDGQMASSLTLGVPEDSAITTGHPGIKVLYQTQDPLTVDQDTNGDAAFAKLDRAGRTITTKAPYTEQVFGCNTAITTATTGSIIAATASKYTFITSWDCTNTGGTATRVILEDSDGTDLANGFLPATSGYFNQPFSDIPAKTNALNKAIQVNVLSSGSSTICCARGFVGVN